MLDGKLALVAGVANKRSIAWAIAQALRPEAIRVNAISAGPVRTLASAGIRGFKDMEAIIEQRSPLGENIEAADVGQAALYLCSPMAKMVTGTTVYVDSGYH